MIDKKGNIIKPDFIELTRYAKQFSGLTIEKENVLLSANDELAPLLNVVTDNFYEAMSNIPEAASYLEGRITGLKQTHLNWMNSIFTVLIMKNIQSQCMMLATFTSELIYPWNS